ncbi:transmembrane protein 238-like isoform X1 [Oncorhynchus keta]|nr:transmembrane protein 238-like isoform X1 [Oncorhynchus keta]
MKRHRIVCLSCYLVLQKKKERRKLIPIRSPSGVTMGLCDGLSHCKLALAFAVLMDLLGGTALLVGVFVPLNIKGRDFGDLLVYTGALFVLMSLGGWVLWYSGNIDGLVSSKELGHIGTTVDRLARTLSRKMHIHRHRGP